MNPWVKRAAKSCAVSTWDREIVFSKAKGPYFWDTNGKKYLDFAVGPGVANIGWNHPKLIEAAVKFLKANSAGYGGNEFLNPSFIELAEKLKSITPGCFSKKVFPSCSGGEAVEAGFIASLLRQRNRKSILSFTGDFHGRMGYGRSATTSKAVHFVGLPRAVDAYYIPFPADNPEKNSGLRKFDGEEYLHFVFSYLERFVSDISLAVMELVQGEGGVNVANKPAISGLVSFLRENGVWVMVDEVQTGFGRTGKMWVAEHFGIEPDVITMAKAAGGGIAPAAYTVLRENLSYQKEREHSNTFGGNPLSSFLTLRVIKIIEEENLIERADEMGWHLYHNLMLAFSGKYNAVVEDWKSGLGLMRRISFQESGFRDAVVEEAKKNGLYLMGAGGASVRLMPPLSVSEKEIEEGVEKLERAVKRVYAKKIK